MPNLKPPLKESGRPSGLAVFESALSVGDMADDGPSIELTQTGHVGQEWETQGYVMNQGAPLMGERTLVGDTSGIVGMVGWANGAHFRFRGRYCTGAGVPLSKWSPWVQATAVF
jgi:hypothetical protein